MKIYKYELESFVKFLHSLKLERRSSRMRTRFKKLLTEKLQEFYEEINEINMNYAQKDDNGTPLIEANKLVFKDDKARLEDISDLANEVIYIEVNEENKDMLISVKDSVLHHSPIEFSGDEADAYDRYCEIVEQINY